MATALIAGLFSLLGAFAGAALSRRTEYEKWLRQARIEAFAMLINEVHDARLKATNVYYDPEGSESDRDMRVTEIYANLGKHVACARLFLHPKSRDVLTELVKCLWLQNTSPGGPSGHTTEINELMRQLQALIEQELKSIPSP